jgi:hypothetical protein
MAPLVACVDHNIEQEQKLWSIEFFFHHKMQAFFTLKAITTEKGWCVQSTRESASTVGEECKEANDCKRNGPNSSLLTQWCNLILCRQLLPSSKESCNKTPHQTQDTAGYSTNSECQCCEK